ncbi:hypothetical protein L7F22_020910 [Adiantum nelumboides]|nr:hypothetical protein [Adiantum nelumboides]
MIWYFDSGASRHITSRKDLFCSLDAAPAGKKVTCANNASSPIKGVGTLENGLFVLDCYEKQIQACIAETKTQAMQDAELWHARFGHVGYGSLMTLQHHNMVHDLSLLEMPPRHVCEGCVLGKMHKFAFSQDGSVRATRKLQLVHSDLRGKLDDKAVKCIFVGYSSGSKGYRLYNPATNKIFESRDVIFAKTTAQPMVAFDVPHMQTQDVFEGFLPSFVENQESQQVDNFDQSFDQHVTPHDVEEIVREEQEVLRKERTLPKEQVDLACFSTLFDADELDSFEQALECVQWKDAMQQEIDSIHKNHTWDLVDLPTGKKPIGTKWVFKVKRKQDGTVDRYKARLGRQHSSRHSIWGFTSKQIYAQPRLLADLCECQQAPTTIFTDSQSAMAVARNPVLHARTKHIEVHYHYVRERLHAGEITLTYCPTQDNIADLFTKALSQEKFEAFQKALGLFSYTG